MKSEHEYNAFFSKECRRISAELVAIKTSDKYTVGISDFLLFRGAGGGALESKFVKDLGTPRRKLLQSHPFTGEQITFLRKMQRTDNPSFGVVAVKPEKAAFLVHVSCIPDEGNWTTGAFMDLDFPRFEWKDVRGMIDYFFMWSAEHG